MTVKELIEQLQQLPQDLQVFTQEECYLFKVDKIKTIRVDEDSDTGYCFEAWEEEDFDYEGILL